jgi:hypothetical protein
MNKKNKCFTKFGYFLRDLRSVHGEVLKDMSKKLDYSIGYISLLE